MLIPKNKWIGVAYFMIWKLFRKKKEKKEVEEIMKNIDSDCQKLNQMYYGIIQKMELEVTELKEYIKQVESSNTSFTPKMIEHKEQAKEGIKNLEIMISAEYKKLNEQMNVPRKNQ